MIAWLRRLFAVLDTASVPVWAQPRSRRPVDIADAIRTAPCEPLRGPDHVMRAARNRADHYRALGEDPDADWGPFVNPYDEHGDDAA